MPSEPPRALEATVAQAVPPAPGDQIVLARPTHDSDIGTLGRYRIKKKLGEGAMGVVYLAYDTALQRKVALKAMNPRDAFDAQHRERFLREARAAAAVRSPHVVTVYDVGEELGNPIIAMEYLKGYSVADYLATKGEVPMPHVLRIGVEIALGLLAAHKLGIVHRDIKPANVWLSAPSAQAKLLDFGLARTVADARLTASGAILGTPAYMSPEQARGEAADQRSDLFSTGALLYRLATGRLPFRGETVFAALTSLATDDPIPPRDLNPKVSPAFAAVILRLLEKDPADRFQSASELVIALQDVIASQIDNRPSAQNEVAVLPLVIQPPAESVWTGIDDAPSHTGEGKARRTLWPIASALVALAVAGASLTLVLARSGDAKKPELVVAKGPDSDPKKHYGPKPGGPPGGQPGGPPGPPPPPPPAALSPEHELAKWVLAQSADQASVGGNFLRGERVFRFSDVPPGPITLTELTLAIAPDVTNEDLKRIGRCDTLTSLGLNATGATDDGLVHLRGLVNLKVLELCNTGIGDNGFAHLAGCKKLRALIVRFSQLSAAGLGHFKNCTGMDYLDLRGCKRFNAEGLKFIEGFAKNGQIIVEETGVSVEDAVTFSTKVAGWTFLFRDEVVQNGRVQKKGQ